jgi:hypothetical protein
LPVAAPHRTSARRTPDGEGPADGGRWNSTERRRLHLGHASLALVETLVHVPSGSRRPTAIPVEFEASLVTRFEAKFPWQAASPASHSTQSLGRPPGAKRRRRQVPSVALLESNFVINPATRL